MVEGTGKGEGEGKAQGTCLALLLFGVALSSLYED